MFVRFLKTLPIIGFASLTLCSQALAQGNMSTRLDGSNSQNTPGNEWILHNFTYTIFGNGVKTNVRGQVFSGELLYTSGQTDPGLAFICLRGKFFATASLDPKDLSTLISTKSHRQRMRLTTLTIDGEVANQERWQYRPALRLISPEKKHARSVAAKMYNAVVRKQSVAIKLATRDPVTLVLPATNTSFSEFGAGCGIGKLAKKK